MGGAGGAEGNGLDADSCVRIEVISCFFANANTPAPASQFVQLGSCLSAVVDGCWFDGAGQPPVQGVRFANSSWSRLSSCTGSGLATYLAEFAFDSLECVEFGNCEGEDPPRIRNEGASQRFVGMSRGALSVPAVVNAASRPSGVNATPGSLLWLTDPGQLQVWDGSNWKVVTTS
jgi:hypothetical protein